MSLEAAAVIDRRGEVLYWHLPADRSAAAIPDSRALWEVLWERRAELAGLAHTHPGRGAPRPSREDLTTFAACEAGLGLRLDWWIASTDQLACLRHEGPGLLDYSRLDSAGDPPWLPQLRAFTERSKA